MTEWAKENRFSVLGISEAKGWANTSDTYLPGIDTIARSWGYSESRLVKLPEDPYGFAIFADKPIVQLATFKEHFAHGGAILEVDGVVYILTQLHPFSIPSRRLEAKIVAGFAANYTAAGRPLIVTNFALFKNNAAL